MADVADRRELRQFRQTPEQRFTQEQEHLQPLLGTDFDIRHVSWDGYIEVGGNRYSVPESLCGQLVSIRISLDDELRIYSNEQQVASHRLCSAAYGWQTVPEHHAPLWQQASERMAEWLGEIPKRVITVCDREADIWHYLYYKVSHGQRGACCTESPAGRGTRQALRTAGSPGNRRKPHAECDAKRRAGSPSGPDVHQLQRSQHKKSRQQRPGAPAHVCLLPGAGRGRCLLASADVRKSGECRRCTTYCQPLRATLADRGIPQGVEKWWYMESLRMQTRDNLERMVVIQAFIAVRVLGLRQGGVSEETQNDSCEKILTPTEWKLLWVKLEGKPLPVQAPTLKWAWGDGMTANAQVVPVGASCGMAGQTSGYG